MTAAAATVLASARSIVDIDATILVEVGLFLLCFLLLRGLIFKPLLRLLDERRAQTQGAREEAKKFEAEADVRTKTVTRAVQQAKVQASEEREQMRQQAKRREQEVLHAAKEEAARITDAARQKVAARRPEAEREAAATARELAGDIATRLAGRAL
jgi:F-type H+-transporting ATPase subunit b